MTSSLSYTAPVQPQSPGFSTDVLQRLRPDLREQPEQTDAAGALPAGRPGAPPAPLRRRQVSKTNALFDNFVILAKLIPDLVAVK